MSPQLQIVSRKCHIQNFLDQLEELSKKHGTTVSVIVITIKKGKELSKYIWVLK